MMDHLVLGVPDLEKGIDLVERKAGVRATFGDRHPGRGTHIALLSLGGWQYLEIFARDRNSRKPHHSCLPGWNIKNSTGPKADKKTPGALSNGLVFHA